MVGAPCWRRRSPWRCTAESQICLTPNSGCCGANNRGGRRRRSDSSRREIARILVVRRSLRAMSRKLRLHAPGGGGPVPEFLLEDVAGELKLFRLEVLAGDVRQLGGVHALDLASA